MSKIAEFKRATEDTDLGEASIYERLRDDIIQGRFVANERLKVSELAERMARQPTP